VRHTQETGKVVGAWAVREKEAGEARGVGAKGEVAAAKAAVKGGVEMEEMGKGATMAEAMAVTERGLGVEKECILVSEYCYLNNLKQVSLPNYRAP